MNRVFSGRIVVTGASGFIGGFLVRALKAQGCEVLGIARSSMQDAFSMRVDSYAETPSGDVLIHLAENGDRAVALAAGATYEMETVRTLKTLIEKGFQKVVYASSAAVYGDTFSVPYGVDAPVVARDPYTRTKLACEAIVLNAGGSIARLSNVYGPGMSSNNVVSTILDQIPGTGPLQVWDDKPVRDFVWVEDVALALAAMAASDCSGIYNVGTGVGIQVGALSSLALDIAGESERSVVATQPSGKLSCNMLDISKTADQLDWMPQTTLEEGMSLMLAKENLEERNE